jgi:hypothetical protein
MLGKKGLEVGPVACAVGGDGAGRGPPQADVRVGVTLDVMACPMEAGHVPGAHDRMLSLAGRPRQAHGHIEGAEKATLREDATADFPGTHRRIVEGEGNDRTPDVDLAKVGAPLVEEATPHPSRPWPHVRSALGRRDGVARGRCARESRPGTCEVSWSFARTTREGVDLPRGSARPLRRTPPRRVQWIADRRGRSKRILPRGEAVPHALRPGVSLL